jgi:outer membrane immunogenic protein
MRSACWLLFPVRAAAAARSDMVKKILIGVAVIAALPGAGALAADLDYRPVPVAPAPPPPPPPNWSGPYIGGALDARFNAVDGNVTSAFVGTPPTAIPLPPLGPPSSNPLLRLVSSKGAMQYIDHIGFAFRIYGGWNWQVAPAYVLGVEADFAYSSEIAAVSGSPYPANLLFGSPSPIPFGATPNDDIKVNTTWDSSVRLRAGWLATPSMMLYLTAGVAWAHLVATSTCSTVVTANVSNCAPGNYFGGTLGPAVISHSATQIGWTGGFGIEMLLGSSWIARVQYRFADFGYPAVGPFKPFSFSDTRTCTGCPANATPLNVSYELPVMQHNFEFGLAYKF